jgi:hypothetical protein
MPLAPTTQLRMIVGAQEEAKSFESEKSCVERYGEEKSTS